MNVSAAEKYMQAILLEGVSSLGLAPTLVLPVGWFRPKRVVEAYIDRAVRLRLNEMIERGVDFERVAYEELAD